MMFRFGNFARTEDGNAVIDWIVLMTGVVLMALSVVITITANVHQITDDSIERVEEAESSHPV
jgi:uncharacterized membrane protein YczE